MAWHPLNEIALRRRGFVIVSAGTNQLPLPYVATALHNWESLGYTGSLALQARLATLDERELTIFYRRLSARLRHLRGSHQRWEPMYPNFPTQVMSASEAELYINALRHYAGDALGTRTLPTYAKAPRQSLREAATLTIIELGDAATVLQLCQNLMASATSISPTDREDIATCLAYATDDLAPLLPPAMPHKENAAYVASLLFAHPLGSDVLLARYFATATDVLRLAVALSHGDISLAQPCKFISFARKPRRILLGLLERCRNLDEDMWRHHGPWVRLGERLHPGEHATRFPNAAAAFARLRQGQRPQTFASRTEAALRQGQAAPLAALLATRPGEFVRRLDHALRVTEVAQHPHLLASLAHVASDVATPVLLQALVHFEHRLTPQDVRPVFPKGAAAKLQALPYTLPTLPSTTVAAVVQTLEAALHTRFAKLPALGPTYIDPRLHNYMVPFSQRSASKALRTLVRGSRLPFANAKTLRFFLWWREGLVGETPTGRVDIDLSAALFSNEFTLHSHISWTNLRALGGVHSGDITSAPHGACEFIDLEVAKVRAAGVRYIVPVVSAFTSQPFCNLPECFMGWMQRSAPASGEIFEPATVTDRVDLASTQRCSLPAIFDLQEGVMIWADVGFGSTPDFHRTVVSSQHGTAAMVRGLVNLRKPTLHRLFTLHATARGTPATSAADATTVFAVDQGVTPYDLETIMATYLR